MNKFFSLALKKATLLAGKQRRLLLLLTQLGTKLQHVNWKEVDTHAVQERLSVFRRLIRAYAMGEYRTIPWKTTIVIIAAVLYFVNPADLVPDLIPLAGFTDDFGVLLMVYNTVKEEIDKFETWEKSQVKVS